MQDAVGFAVTEGAEDDALGLQTAGQEASGTDAIFSEVMSGSPSTRLSRVASAATAKSLLDKRNVPFNEVNLAKDPSGRTELVG